jgi:hypothetical protein
MNRAEGSRHGTGRCSRVVEGSYCRSERYVIDKKREEGKEQKKRKKRRERKEKLT